MYGETSFELVDQMIRTIEFSPEDKFIDLGSGVSLFSVFQSSLSHSMCVRTKPGMRKRDSGMCRMG